MNPFSYTRAAEYGTTPCARARPRRPNTSAAAPT